jgi:hypothetical protein
MNIFHRFKCKCNYASFQISTFTIKEGCSLSVLYHRRSNNENSEFRIRTLYSDGRGENLVSKPVVSYIFQFLLMPPKKMLRQGHATEQGLMSILCNVVY